MFVHKNNAITLVRVVMARKIQHQLQILMSLYRRSLHRLLLLSAYKEVVNRDIPLVHRVMLEPDCEDLYDFAIQIMLLSLLGLSFARGSN